MTQPMSFDRASGSGHRLAVAIVDDDVRICRSLRELINGFPGMICSDIYGTVASALNGIVANEPDIVLLDIGLPDISGLEAIAAIQELCPQARIIMHSNYDHEEKILQAMKSGAAGYLLKNQDTTALSQAIEVVRNGGTVWPAGYAEFMQKPPRPAFLQKIRTTLRKLVKR